MTMRAWTVKLCAPKCDACGEEGPVGEDDSSMFLRKVAERAGWWVRHADAVDLFMLCAACRARVAPKAKAGEGGENG